MPAPSRKRELGRGERVLPGLWRLRLPLPWPGVPHGNAWALAAGDGIVLVDTGVHEPGSMAQLERALAQCGLKVDNVRTVVCTHAHSDHYGQAATIAERTGCDVWLHPNHEHLTRYMEDPQAAFERRIEVALQSGVPEEPLRRYAEARREDDFGIAGLVEPMRDLVPGVEIETDLGSWSVHYTPGHAPSHVCLFEPGRRLLISGDHLLGRVSLFYDYGWTPDPVGEFLESLNVVEALDARLCLPGHGRTFADVQAHIDANRELIALRLARVERALRKGPRTAFEIVPDVYDQPLTPVTAGWWLQETLSYLRHLEHAGIARRIDGEPERWEHGAQAP